MKISAFAASAFVNYNYIDETQSLGLWGVKEDHGKVANNQRFTNGWLEQPALQRVAAARWDRQLRVVISVINAIISATRSFLWIVANNSKHIWAIDFCFLLSCLLQTGPFTLCIS